MIKDTTILHFFDDDKFIDPAIKLFESVIPESSIYYILNNGNTSFKYVKSKKAIPLDLNNKELITSIFKDKNKVLFFHALNKSKQELICNFPTKAIKVWFIWGYDLYNNWKILKKDLFEKETIASIKNINLNQKIKNKYFFNKTVFNVCYLMRVKLHLLPQKVSNFIKNNYFNGFYLAAEKIDIVVPVVPNEYDLVKAMKIKPVFAPFTYGCIEDMLLNDLCTKSISKSNILVGNSGYPTNNHIDVFKKLAALQIGKRNVYVPLSYGGTPEYINKVILKGKEYFGDNFKPLINFMPLDDYNKIISSCGIIIFNHIRQQALGNIIPLGYHGAKIFLNSKSPVYNYFKKEGIFVFNFKEINQSKIDVLLTEKESTYNKQKFFDLYSNESVKNKIETLINIVSLKLDEKTNQICQTL